MKNYAKNYHLSASAKAYQEYKNRKKAKTDRKRQKALDLLNKAEHKGFNLVSYNDTTVDALFKACIIAFCGQRAKQPERADFWSYQMYEYISANAKGELTGTFINDAYLKFMDFDEKERTENIDLYARKSANNAVYTFKYKGDGKSLASKNDDFAKIATSDNNTIISLVYPHYADTLKHAVVENLVSRLTEKQSYAVTFWLNNAVLFDTLEDIFDFGTDENGKKVRFFKNFESFKRTFYRGISALKAIAKTSPSVYMPDFNTLLNALYENKSYNAVVLANKYGKAKAESEKRLKAEKASGIVKTYYL